MPMKLGSRVKLHRMPRPMKLGSVVKLHHMPGPMKLGSMVKLHHMPRPMKLGSVVKLHQMLEVSSRISSRDCHEMKNIFFPSAIRHGKISINNVIVMKLNRPFFNNYCK